MKAVRSWFVVSLIFACMIAGASPRLVVPHGRLGHAGMAGPSAIWHGAAGAFLIETSGDLQKSIGTLQRRPLNIGADGAISYGAGIAWEAAAVIEKGAARKIYTSDQAGATIAFDWSALPPATRALMEQTEPGAAADGMGEMRTAFLRGDRAREAGQPQGLFRKRDALLGDIINSTPLIVGAPPATIADSSHAAFRERYRQRELTVYAGANDGMLHAFSAAGGAELFAYVPAALVRHLPALTSPAYKGRPYVDGSPGHGDAKIGAAWRTVLASGMGMGARGVFALDITDPANVERGALALWEFTEADDPVMGHVREPPLIASINTGKGANGRSRGYFAVVSSGINNLAPDGGGALFLLGLGKSASDKWQQGANYFRIATSGTGAPSANALSPPALVIDADGSAGRAYAGDLLGNLWRFDFSSMKAQRLFTARDASGAAQPIAHAPRIVHGPGGGYLVLFATGKLIEESDLLPSSFTQQSVYAVFDAPGAGREAVGSRSDLARRTPQNSAAGYVLKGESFGFTGPDKKMGWYFDLPNAGERGAGSPVSIAGAVAIASLIPGAVKDSAPTSRLYLLDALSGFAHADASGGKPNTVTGNLASIDPLLPLLLVDVALERGKRSATGGVTVTRSVTLVSPHAGQGASAANIDVRYPAGRMGWREVANWKELHQAAVRKGR